MPRAAGLIGHGSEVLAFDTERLDDVVEASLPDTFEGWPTRFAKTDGAPVRHQVEVTSVRRWFTNWIGFDPSHGVEVHDWLSAPSQLLRAVTEGAVLEDGLGELTKARRRLAWYPHDVWLYLLACQWRRLDQEEAFVGRTGEVGDELGSAIVAARLVRELMLLCFLVERSYAPYTKWLGTAFARLRCGPRLIPVLRAALGGREWHARERHLVEAFEAVAEMFNELAVVEKIDPSVRRFHSRPFLVLGSARFAEACMGATPLRELGWLGSIDQWADSTDVLSNPAVFVPLRRRYSGGPGV